jgi:3-isopropylmalate dehydratase small subunit
VREARPTVFTGRAWILGDVKGGLLDDVDTDQIYHNAHLAVTDVQEMGRYALGNLKGWEDFPSEVGPGDVLVAGSNFGAGSSRQHAVDCFISLGVAAILARSFAPIYKRNAINSGLPILACPALAGSALRDNQTVEVRFREAKVLDAQTGETLASCTAPSEVQLQIYRAGNLFSYGSVMAHEKKG